MFFKSYLQLSAAISFRKTFFSKAKKELPAVALFGYEKIGFAFKRIYAAIGAIDKIVFQIQKKPQDSKDGCITFFFHFLI